MTHLEVGVPVCVVFLVYFILKLRNNGLKSMMDSEEVDKARELAEGQVQMNLDNDPNAKLNTAGEAEKKLVKEIAGESDEEEEEVCKPNPLTGYVSLLVLLLDSY